MSTAERDAQREDLRERIMEAARDIVGEHGLDALSMRALALRIDHSPGTIYHYFRDKEELVGSVMSAGSRLLSDAMEREVGKLAADATPLQRYAAAGRAYARFALENTSYFRAMFEMPGVAQLEGCPGQSPAALNPPEAWSFESATDLMRQASESGEVTVDDPVRASLVGWGLVHGLTSLYVSGYLGNHVDTHDEFMDLVETAIHALGVGWRPREQGERKAANA